MKQLTLIWTLGTIIVVHQLSLCNTRYISSDFAADQKENYQPLIDTISYWRVYNGGKLIGEGSLLDKAHIFLKKGNILAKDTLVVSYFDDTPCHNCNSTLTLITNGGKEIRTLQSNQVFSSSFSLRTTDLQVLAFRNTAQVLKFYFKEHDGADKIYLLEIEII